MLVSIDFYSSSVHHQSVVLILYCILGIVLFFFNTELSQGLFIIDFRNLSVRNGDLSN